MLKAKRYIYAQKLSHVQSSKIIKIKFIKPLFPVFIFFVVLLAKNSYSESLYTIKIGIYKNIEFALEAYKELPKRFKKNAFILKEKKGYLSLNLFRFKTKQKALIKTKDLKKTFKHCSVLKTKTENIINVQAISSKNKARKNHIYLYPKSDNLSKFYTETMIYKRMYDIFGIRRYISRVERANLDLKIAFKDYKRSLLTFNQTLNAYRWNVGFEANAGESYDGIPHFNSGAGIVFNKILYNGGVYPVLSKEEEIIDYLERQKLINKNDILVLSAISAYSAKLYSQEMKNFVENQFKEREKLFQTVKQLYQKGETVSKYAYLTEKRELIKLNIELLKTLNSDKKTGFEFRYLGRIYSQKPIRLNRFNVDYKMYFPELQKKALVNSSILKRDRYQFTNSLLDVEVSKRDNKPLISFSGKTGISHSTNATGTKNEYYSVSINLTYPIFDGGIRKTNLAIEKLSALKAKLRMQKDSENIIKKLSILYQDYVLYAQEESKLKEMFEVDKERLNISKTKYLQGMGNYTSIRDSWNDLIDTREKLLNAYIMKNKIMLDMLVISGEKL